MDFILHINYSNRGKGEKYKKKLVCSDDYLFIIAAIDTF